MKLFIFLLKKRTTAYFSLSHNWKEQLGDFLLAVLLISTGVSLAVLNNYTLSHPTKRIDSSAMLQAVKVTLLISPLILKLFPSFSLKKIFIGPEYPLNKYTVAFLDLFALSLYRTRYAIYVLFICSYCFMANNVNTYVVVSLFLLLGTGIMLAENIINAISWRKYFYLAIILMTAIAQYVAAGGNYNPSVTLLFSLFVLLLHFALYFFCYERNYEGSTRAHSINAPTTAVGRNISNNLHWALLFRNKQVITVLSIGIGFKLLILCIFLFMKNGNLSMIMDRVPFILCLVTPLILFSYVYNNIWGYFYQVALNNLIIQAAPRNYVKMYLELLFPALMADAAITFACLAIANMIEWKIIATYLVFAFLSVAVGIISSFRKYFAVPAAFDFNRFRAKTSRRYTFLLLIPGMVAGLLYNMPLYLVLLLGILLLTGIGLWIYISKNMYACTLKLKQDFFNA